MPTIRSSLGVLIAAHVLLAAPTPAAAQATTSAASDRAAQAVDTLDVSGPWDDMTLGLDGNLAFVKGDQML
jgi:hypothetical protein